MEVAVLGAGNWGTTLAILLSQKGHRVVLWEFFPENVERIKKDGENRQFLPGISIPQEIQVTADLADIRKSEFLLFALPSHAMRDCARLVAGAGLKNPILVSVVKGIENSTLKRMSEVLEEEIPQSSRQGICVLSGPCIANEVARGVPTTVVASSPDEKVARRVQETTMGSAFRVYINRDVVGVELGGALKNVIVVAAGACDGLGLGANTKGALLTRGLAEITRLGVALGAKPMTFAGLSGMGDLITTSFSSHSRNRYVGEEIAAGRSLDDILSSMVMVAEGVKTTLSARDLASRHGVEMPITEQVYQVLFKGKPPKEAISDLMLREPKPEVWG